MFRFSLAALLLFVLFAAVGCAALVNGGELWRQAMVTATVVLLLTATLAAVVWQGERRTAAAGFAVFGWAYLVLTFVSALQLRSDLLTDKAVASLYPMMHGTNQTAGEWRDMVVAFSPQGEMIANVDGTVRLWDGVSGQSLRAGQVLTSVSTSTPSYEDFADIGHALWAVLAACLGAAIARGLAAMPARQRQAP
jgi:hypothetical protein